MTHETNKQRTTPLFGIVYHYTETYTSKGNQNFAVYIYQINTVGFIAKPYQVRRAEDAEDAWAEDARAEDLRADDARAEVS